MITYRLARVDDNAKLIQLAASSYMPGAIGLRIERSPDFFSLTRRRGDTIAFVAESGNELIGVICLSHQQVYIGGAIHPLCYVGDLKVAAPYRNQGIGTRLGIELENYVISRSEDLVFLNYSYGNSKPVFLFSNRPQVPDFESIGTFTIYQLIGKKQKRDATSFGVREQPVSDRLLDFLNRHQRRYQLGNVVTAGLLEDTSLYTIEENGKPVAAMSLMDTMPLKQNVITSLPWNLKLLLGLTNGYCALTGLSRMPRLFEPVKMLYIRHLAVEPGRESLVKPLISQARHLAFQKGYSYVSIGLHEKDPMNQRLSGLPRLSFRSAGMLLSVKNNHHLISQVKNGTPYEDYSLV